MTYAAHPEGIVEYQKSRATKWVERRVGEHCPSLIEPQDRGSGPPGVGVVPAHLGGGPPGGGPDWSPGPSGPRRRPLLSVRSVVKRFGGVAAVDGASFDVARARPSGLVGPNGAGKTTLFNCLCGQLRPEQRDRRRSTGRCSTTCRPTGGHASGIGRTFQRVEVFPEHDRARPHDRGRTGPPGRTGRCGRTC